MNINKTTSPIEVKEAIDTVENEIMDYRKSHLQKDHAESYHKEFERDPHRKMIWQLEKKVLDHMMGEFFKNTEINHFDFACGTGRILSHLESWVNSSFGVDISPAMLEVARKHNKEAEIIEVDLTASDILGTHEFNLITAFRFFPNAQAELRSAAMEVIVRHLQDDGYIVFNNHTNASSTIYRLARLFGRGGSGGMSIAEVQALVTENNLEIVKIYHIGVIPMTGNHMILPAVILQPIEWFLSRIPLLRNFAQDHVVICKKR